MDNDLLSNGLLLMVIGMGTVFAFLTVMVVCIQISAKVAAKFAHLLPEEPKKPAKRAAKPKVAASEDEGALLAVLTAAVRKYRGDH